MNAFVRIAPLAWVLAACPSLDTPEIRIDGADPEVLPTATELSITVLGAGFGLAGARYSLSEQKGSSAGDRLTAILVGPGNIQTEVTADGVVVESPTRLRLELRRSSAPVPGIYGLQLRRGLTLLAENRVVFELLAADQTRDAGTSDSGVEPDGGPDAGEADLGTGDLGPADAGDLGSLDLGPADMGAPFFGGYGFRSPLSIPNEAAIAAGVTLRVPIPHAAFVAAARSRADGADLVVYQGSTPLAFQWEDPRQLGTNDLVMVVALAAGLPARPAEGSLTLYFGDPTAQNAVSDGVFAFSQRFDAPLSLGEDDSSLWFAAATWERCPYDQGQDAELASGSVPGAYCAYDSNSSSLVRSTLASPVLPQIAPLPSGQVFEMRLWLAGRTIDGPDDILYFSHGADNRTFHATTELPLSAWSGFSPSDTLSFRDTDDDGRTVQGWRFSQTQIEWWKGATARFSVSETGGRALHLRAVSTDNDSSRSSFYAVDDWTVRVAAEPEPVITLGAISERS